MNNILKINNLSVSFDTEAGEQTALSGINMEVKCGEILALVGESGCGKTVLCKTILQILCKKGIIKTGEIFLQDENLLNHTEKEMEYHRGKDIAMIFQDPMTSLNPTISIGNQIAEVLIVHNKVSKKEAKAEACRLMEMVGFDQVEKRYRQMPHHFSGGMRQRVAIAIALAGKPKLLLADEPTTHLDVKIQEQILVLLKKISKEKRISTIFITHDLSVVDNIADRVAIMKDGIIVESGLVSEVFQNPVHEYTKQLLIYADYGKRRGHTHGAIHFHDGKAHSHKPNFNNFFDDENKKKIIEIKNLSKYFKLDNKTLNTVLENINMDIYEGEVLGIVGPSGCGKSTLAKCIMGIYQPSGGEIINLDNDTKSKDVSWKQMIFQDSSSAFNPRMTIEKIIGEPLKIKNGKFPDQDVILNLMDDVELSHDLINRYPYEVSGGQRQRAAIARAISTNPALIVADEPIASLDISIQAQIIHLFKKLQNERGITLVLIAHDLPMVQHISDRIIDLSVIS